jgi:hypothetical protein
VRLTRSIGRGRVCLPRWTRCVVSKGSRCHINGRVNNPLSIPEELSFSPTSNAKLHHQSVRVTDSHTSRGIACLPGAVSVGFSSECGEKEKGGLVGRYKAEVSFIPPEAQEVELQGGRSKGKRGGLKRSTRVWRPKRTKHIMVLGMDVGLEESCNLALCALVGRLAYRSCCKIHSQSGCTVTGNH